MIGRLLAITLVLITITKAIVMVLRTKSPIIINEPTMTIPASSYAPLVIHLYPEDAGADNLINTPDKLAAYGVRCMTCADVAGLKPHLKRRGPIVVLLDGRPSKSFEYTAATRVLHPDIGIMVVAELSQPQQVLAHLHAGADVWIPQDAPVSVLAAQLFRLIWRLRRLDDLPAHRLSASSNEIAGDTGHNTVGQHRLQPPAGQWVVADQGWTIWTPDGQSVTLSPTERAFLSTLWKAPEGRAAHACLRAAIQVLRKDAMPASKPYLGVIVSRMRRKFSTAGIVLPVQSVHNWGYTLTARFIDIEAPPED